MELSESQKTSFSTESSFASIFFQFKKHHLKLKKEHYSTTNAYSRKQTGNYRL
jgi:hypothetical protein